MRGDGAALLAVASLVNLLRRLSALPPLAPPLAANQVNGGYLLFTIFHASVTVFSCALAVVLLKAQITWLQWAGVGLIVVGIFTTTIPSPLEVGSLWPLYVCTYLF